jgi:hypothetical protein
MDNFNYCLNKLREVGNRVYNITEEEFENLKVLLIVFHNKFVNTLNKIDNRLQYEIYQEFLSDFINDNAVEIYKYILNIDSDLKYNNISDLILKNGNIRPYLFEDIESQLSIYLEEISSNDQSIDDDCIDIYKPDKMIDFDLDNKIINKIISDTAIGLKNGNDIVNLISKKINKYFLVKLKCSLDEISIVVLDQYDLKKIINLQQIKTKNKYLSIISCSIFEGSNEMIQFINNTLLYSELFEYIKNI